MDVIGLHAAVEPVLAHTIAGVVGPAICAVLQGVAVADRVAIFSFECLSLCVPSTT